MKLKKVFEEVEKEEKEETTSKGHKYGCVMVNLPINKMEWDSITDIKEEDVYQPEGDRSYGVQPHDEVHVTVLYGLHSDIPDETIEELVSKMTAPEITLKEISLFQNENFDVVKLDVESEDLNKMNSMFAKLPHTTDYPDYHPHCTSAYVKAGNGDKYVRTLPKEEVLTLIPHKIVYSKVDGSKKEYDFST